MSRQTFCACLLASSFLVLAIAPHSPVLAQAGDPLAAEQTSALVAERDRLQQIVRLGGDGRTVEQAKIQVMEKEIGQGRSFTAEEAKKESLLAERDILKTMKQKAGPGGGRMGGDGSGYDRRSEERLAVVNVTLATGRDPTADEQKQIESKLAARDDLVKRQSMGRTRSDDEAKLAVINKELAAGESFTPDEAKKEILLAERDYLAKLKPARGGGGAGTGKNEIDRRGEERLAVLNATIASGRDPTADEKKQIDAKLSARNDLVKMQSMGRTRSDDEAKLAVINKELAAGKSFTPDEAKKETLLAERDYLAKLKPARPGTGSGTGKDTIDRRGEERLAVLNSTLALGRDPTADEKKQIEAKLSARNDLVKMQSMGRTRSDDEAKLAVINKELAAGKSFTPDEAKKETLLAERDYLSKLTPMRPGAGGGTGKNTIDRRGEVRLAVLNATVALGRDPTADEKKQIETKIADRDSLVKMQATGRSRSGDEAKLAVINKELAAGKSFTPDEAKKETALAERDYLAKLTPMRPGAGGGTGKNEIDRRGEERLAVLNMTIAAGRDPTADEKKQIETKLAERDSLVKMQATGRSRSGDEAKLAVLNKELAAGKSFTPEQAKKETMQAERDYLAKLTPMRDGALGKGKDMIDRRGQERLAVLNMTLTLGRDPNPAEIKQLRDKTAERDRLQREAAKGGGSLRASDQQKLAALNNEIDKRQGIVKNDKVPAPPAPQPKAVGAIVPLAAPALSAAIKGAGGAGAGNKGLAPAAEARRASAPLIKAVLPRTPAVDAKAAFIAKPIVTTRPRPVNVAAPRVVSAPMAKILARTAASSPAAKAVTPVKAPAPVKVQAPLIVPKAAAAIRR